MFYANSIDLFLHSKFLRNLMLLGCFIKFIHPNTCLARNYYSDSFYVTEGAKPW